jgi:CRP/FNR family transcriptional regulator, cyclic AMP receptor protein
MFSWEIVPSSNLFMKTILLIEDHPDIRNIISDILELASYKVVTADNGKEGVALALQHVPDLIICDIMMPIMDGYAVIHALQKHTETQSVPFIFMTAMADRADIRKGMALGADDYITKPLMSSDELLTAVETRLKRADLLKKAGGNGLDGLNNLIVSAGGKDIMENLTEGRNIQKYKKRQTIYNEGERPQYLFYIQRGKVKAFKTNDDGKELVTSIFTEGEFFGYNAIIEEDRYKESAEVMEEAEVAMIPGEDFKGLMSISLEASKKFAKLLANNITEREEKLLGIAYNSLRKKVASALIALHSKYKTDSHGGTINIGRENLANFAGTAKESVIRTLSDFKEEKLIDIVDSNIIILNEARLRNLFN